MAAEGEKASMGTSASERIAQGRQPFLTHQIADMLLLKTPTSQLAVNGGSQHPDKRKAGGHGPTLADEVEHLLPTPTVGMTQGGNRTRSGARSGELLLNGLAEAVTEGKLLPTPRAQNGEERNQRIWSRPADQPQNLENALAVTPPSGGPTPQLFVDGKLCEEPPLPLQN